MQASIECHVDAESPSFSPRGVSVGVASSHSCPELQVIPNRPIQHMHDLIVTVAYHSPQIRTSFAVVSRQACENDLEM